MSDTMPEEKTGAVNETPETQPRRGRPPGVKIAPVPPPQPPPRPALAAQPAIEWVTREESERLETLVGKNFVRREERENGETKKYFYRVMSACPSVPGGVLTSKHQSLVEFSVQKFMRKQFKRSKVVSGGATVEELMNEPAAWVEINTKTGDAEVIDPDANFMMDSKRFESEFKRDEN